MGAEQAAGLLELIDGRRGHFQLESGHHGELWLDLDTLFVRPARLVPFVEDLAEQLARRLTLTAVCGPLLGGALLAGAVAALLVLGTSAAAYAEQEGLALLHAQAMPNRIWEPRACPLCAAGEPLEDPGASATIRPPRSR